MICYPAHQSLFEFASAPRTGSTWFMHACYEVGFGNGSKSKAHEYFPKEKSTMPRVTIVRHPCEWLLSYFNHVYPAKLGIATDELSNLSLVLDSFPTFDAFVRMVLKKCPGVVGRVFSHYKADVYLRTDSINASFYELCLSMGVSMKNARKARALAPINSSVLKSRWNPALYDRVLDVEKDFVNQYDF